MATQSLAYRFFGKYHYRDQMAFANGDDAKDSAGMGRVGFRADHERGQNDLTLSGDFYNSTQSLLGRESAKVLGGNVMGRWTRAFSPTSDLQIQTYYERNYRRVPLQSEFDQKTFDIDLQHQFAVGALNTIVWGAGYRYTKDRTQATQVVSFTPADRSYALLTAFIADELSLASGRLKLLLGSKLEHNDYSGGEIQPSVRASWDVEPNHTVWGALSRAVRTPTRFDSDIRFTPGALVISGNPEMESEEVIAVEAGYRVTPIPWLSLDAASFYNFYDRLRSLELQSPPANITLLNNLNARSWGGELSVGIAPAESVRFTTGYSLFVRKMTAEPGTRDVFDGSLEGNDPRHSFLVRASTDLPGNLEWDSMFRFVASLPNPSVPPYGELESRLGWLATPHIDLAIVGRNLLDAQHPEFGPASPQRPEVERNVYFEITIRY